VDVLSGASYDFDESLWQILLSSRTLILYGCETWSLTLREEHRLRVSEKRVLRIFGLHNGELHNLYSSPSIIKMVKSRMRLALHVAGMGKKKNAYRILMGNPEGKRPLGRPKTILKWILG
jgi:hypothetical protein